VIPTTLGVETSTRSIKSVSIPDLLALDSVPPDVLTTTTALPTKTAIRMVAALLALMTLVAL